MGRRTPPSLILAVRVPFALAWVVTFGGCAVESPDFPDPGDDGLRKGSVYADVVISVGSGKTVVSCLDGIPACKDGVTPVQTGDCANNAALGMNDGKSFSLGPNGVLEFGILCDAIVEVGGTTGASDDFMIWGTFTGGALPVVEVSVDGSSYAVVNPWPDPRTKKVDNPGFQLEAANLVTARFVRVSNAAAKGTISIDALEAFPVKRK